MSRVFAIGDLHFGHRKLQEIRGITDEDLIRNWNAVVRKRDVVYVLGDVFRLEPVAELAGIKKLALGNHDGRRIEEYLRFFSKVHAMFEVRGMLLTHVPVHPGQRRRWSRNVHGHTHTFSLDDPWYWNVSAEVVDYTPCELS